MQAFDPKMLMTPFMHRLLDCLRAADGLPAPRTDHSDGIEGKTKRKRPLQLPLPSTLVDLKDLDRERDRRRGRDGESDMWRLTPKVDGSRRLLVATRTTIARVSRDGTTLIDYSVAPHAEPIPVASTNANIAGTTSTTAISAPTGLPIPHLIVLDGEFCQCLCCPRQPRSVFFAFDALVAVTGQVMGSYELYDDRMHSCEGQVGALNGALTAAGVGLPFVVQFKPSWRVGDPPLMSLFDDYSPEATRAYDWTTWVHDSHSYAVDGLIFNRSDRSYMRPLALKWKPTPTVDVWARFPRALLIGDGAVVAPDGVQTDAPESNAIDTEAHGARSVEMWIFSGRPGAAGSATGKKCPFPPAPAPQPSSSSSTSPTDDSTPRAEIDPSTDLSPLVERLRLLDSAHTVDYVDCVAEVAFIHSTRSWRVIRLRLDKDRCNAEMVVQNTLKAVANCDTLDEKSVHGWCVAAHLTNTMNSIDSLSAFFGVAPPTKPNESNRRGHRAGGASSSRSSPAAIPRPPHPPHPPSHPPTTSDARDPCGRDPATNVSTSSTGYDTQQRGHLCHIHPTRLDRVPTPTANAIPSPTPTSTPSPTGSDKTDPGAREVRSPYPVPSQRTDPRGDFASRGSQPYPPGYPHRSSATSRMWGNDRDRDRDRDRGDGDGGSGYRADRTRSGPRHHHRSSAPRTGRSDPRRDMQTPMTL